jgi:hypothetical protein
MESSQNSKTTIATGWYRDAIASADHLVHKWSRSLGTVSYFAVYNYKANNGAALVDCLLKVLQIHQRNGMALRLWHHGQSTPALLASKSNCIERRFTKVLMCLISYWINQSHNLMTIQQLHTKSSAKKESPYNYILEFSNASELVVAKLIRHQVYNVTDVRTEGLQES